MDIAQLIPFVLVGLSVTLGIFGVWLMIGDRSSEKGRIQGRMMGVRQVKRLELGDSLAKTREAEQKKKDQRREVIKQQAFSDIPAIDLALKKTPWADKLQGMLLQCQMPMSVTSFILLSILMAALGVAISMVYRGQARLDPIMAVLFGGVMGFSPILFVYFKVRSRIRKFGRQLPDALDLVSSSVKGGQSLNAAIQNVADEMPEPVCDEFRILSDELMFGVEFNTAMRHMVNRVDTPDVRFFAAALEIQKETGGNLGEVLDGLQHTIRERFRILGMVKTLTAQGKLSGLIVGLLPFVLAAAIYMLNPDYMTPLFTEKRGHMMLMVGGGLQMLGLYLIYRIVNIKV